KIYSGINQTRTVNCTVLRANPSYITFEISNSLPNSIIRRINNEQNNDLYYAFEITPTNIEQFRPFNVTARNSVGFDTCTYELLHGGVPDAIINCSTEIQFNVTIQIKCQKSYAQGDIDGYTCVLFKYKPNETPLFEEIARSKSCIFAFDYFSNPAEYRVSAFNKYGTLPVSTYGYPVHLNRREVPKQSPLLSNKMVIIIASVIGGIILLVLVCCCCGNKLKSNDRKYKEKYPRSSSESEPMKPNSDDSIATSHLTQNGADKSSHLNGSTVYDVPGSITKDPASTQQMSTSLRHYHQQQNGSIHYIDNSSNSSLNSLPTRTRTFANKVYSINDGLDNKYGPLSEDYSRPEEILEVDEDSPVYSTTTDIMSESGSFLVSSSKKRAPPPPKPRYSTLRSVRGNLPSMTNNNTIDDKTLPLPKPRSRSNSRTRLNGGNDTPNSSFYDERPISSSDSGVCDVICLPNGETIRTGIVKSRQQNLQKHYASPHYKQIPLPPSQKSLSDHNTSPSFNHQSLLSPIVRGTELGQQPEKENNDGFSQLIETKKVDNNTEKENIVNKKRQHDNENVDDHLACLQKKRSKTDSTLNNNQPQATETISHVSLENVATTDLDKTLDVNTNITTHVRQRSKTTSDIEHDKIKCSYYQNTADRHSERTTRRRSCLCSKKPLNELCWLERGNDILEFPVPVDIQQLILVNQPEPSSSVEISDVVPVMSTLIETPAPVVIQTEEISTMLVYDSLGCAANTINDTSFEKKIEKLQQKVIIKDSRKKSPTMEKNRSKEHRVTFHDQATIIDDQTIENVKERKNDQMTQTNEINQRSIKIQTEPVTACSSTNTHEIQYVSSMTQTSNNEIKKLNQSTQVTPLIEEQEQQHQCCPNVTTCPCVQMYGKTEQFLLQTFSAFFNCMPTTTTTTSSIINNRNRKTKRRYLNRSRRLSVITRNQEYEQQPREESDVNANDNVDDDIIVLGTQYQNISVIDTSTMAENENENQENLYSTFTVLKEEPLIEPLTTIEPLIEEEQVLDLSIVHNTTMFDQKDENHPVQHITELSSMEMAMLIKSPILEIEEEEKKRKRIVVTSSSLSDQEKLIFDEFVQLFNLRTSFSVDETTTHLITEEENETLTCPLTGKVIQAISRHLFVVSFRWIVRCLREKRLVSEEEYEMHGDYTLENNHNGMKKSRLNPEHLLFGDYAFMLKCTGCSPFTDNLPLIEMIKLSGGVFISNLTQAVAKRKTIVLCSENFIRNKPSLFETCQKANVHCLKPEWLLISITKHEIQPYSDHEILR
ncbi:unnamed protein product, partial [Didymodactylos carnosus]